MTCDLRTQAKHPNPNLETVIARMLPTPTTRDYKDAGPNVNYQKLADKSRLAGTVVITCQATGEATYLNPSFVEEMMGFPIGHTVSEPSVTL